MNEIPNEQASLIAELSKLEGIRGAIGASEEIAQTYRDGCCSFVFKHHAVLVAALAEPEQACESDKDVALAQAVEFAEYVESRAKGAMADAAKRFLSLPYSQEIAKRLALAEVEARTVRGRVSLAPTGESVFTYKNQPNNIGAWRLGRACSNAKPGGDPIDYGLSLLKELQAEGYGVVMLSSPTGVNQPFGNSEELAARWVTQTKFYDPALPADICTGNCTEAAVASLLGIGLDDVPSFQGLQSVEYWEALDNFAESRGFLWQMRDGEYHYPGLYLADGPSPRGCGHFVVMRDGEMEHDPHPSRAGLTKIERTWVLIPFDPAVIDGAKVR